MTQGLVLLHFRSTSGCIGEHSSCALKLREALRPGLQDVSASLAVRLPYVTWLHGINKTASMMEQSRILSIFDETSGEVLLTVTFHRYASSVIVRFRNDSGI